MATLFGHTVDLPVNAPTGGFEYQNKSIALLYSPLLYMISSLSTFPYTGCAGSLVHYYELLYETGPDQKKPY